MDQRGAVTDQLADVIRIAQLVHKTGTLIVERDGGNGGLEEGRITFVEGRVTEASAGRLSGQQAFDWLNTWGTCRFVFVSSLSASSGPLQSAMQGARSTDRLLSTDRLSSSPVSGPIGAAPYRIREVNDVLPLFGAMGLTRVHRQLFLLVDGQRTVPDLIRLSARGAEEVRRLLVDLERAGMIQQ